MAIEIREMIIKTVVRQDHVEDEQIPNKIDYSKMRKELLQECKKMIKQEKMTGKYSR